MTRRTGAGLLVGLVLLLVAFAVGARGTAAAHRVSAVSSFVPCPAGLSPELPHLSLDCLGGGPRVAVSSAASAAPTLVNVWATWCPPCQRETPFLVAFQARALGRVGVVGVLTEDDQSNGLRFAHDFGMRYPSVVDPDGTIMRAFPPGPPTTLFVDAAGHVVYRHGGQFHSEAEIEQLVAGHLGVRL